MSNRMAHSRRHCPVSSFADSVAPAFSDDAPQPVAANTYDPCRDALTKVYPTVDRGHVAGDPPIIDHSVDIASVSNQSDNVASANPTGGGSSRSEYPARTSLAWTFGKSR